MLLLPADKVDEMAVKVTAPLFAQLNTLLVVTPVPVATTLLDMTYTSTVAVVDAVCT